MFFYNKYLRFLSFFMIILFMNSCGIYKPVDTRKVPVIGEERARKNLEEGRGISIGNLRNRSTTYEFSTSNPMWRATFDVIDFMPLVTVDYSGGTIITDWYTDCLLYTSPSPRDQRGARMPSTA